MMNKTKMNRSMRIKLLESNTEIAMTTMVMKNNKKYKGNKIKK